MKQYVLFILSENVQCRTGGRSIKYGIHLGVPNFPHRTGIFILQSKILLVDCLHFLSSDCGQIIHQSSVCYPGQGCAYGDYLAKSGLAANTQIYEQAQIYAHLHPRSFSIVTCSAMVFEKTHTWTWREYTKLHPQTVTRVQD